MMANTGSKTKTVILRSSFIAAACLHEHLDKKNRTGRNVRAYLIGRDASCQVPKTIDSPTTAGRFLMRRQTASNAHNLADK
jgi:hypothetical protein